MNWSAIQNAVIDAVEKAKSSQLATGHYNHSYAMGYAKRDVLIEIGKAFAELEELDAKRLMK